MKILVTGSSGFIGKQLVAELINFHDVEGIDLAIDTDIRTEPLDTHYDIIYHLAALRSVPASFKRPREFFDTNVYGTYRLLTQANYKKFVNISSSSAEQAISPYGMSKFLTECMLQKRENVLNIRPFNVFGEGQTVEGPLVRNFCKAMSTGEPVYIHGNGYQCKDYTYVQDFIKQLIYLADNNDSGTFDVGYQEPHSVREIYDFLAKEFNYKQAPIYVGARKGDVIYSKAKDKMNIKPIGFYEGLKRTAEWWKSAS